MGTARGIVHGMEHRADVAVPASQADAVTVVDPHGVVLHEAEAAPEHDADDAHDAGGDPAQHRGATMGAMTGFGEVETGTHSLLDLAACRIPRWIRVRDLL